MKKYYTTENINDLEDYCYEMNKMIPTNVRIMIVGEKDCPKKIYLIANSEKNIEKTEDNLYFQKIFSDTYKKFCKI